MNRFRVCYKVNATLQAVAEFHCQPQALRKLTPRPLFLQLHRADPLAENSIVEFTLWHGLFPVRWKALHTDVDVHSGFTDTQLHGPLLYWQHTHSYCALNQTSVMVCETVDYQHRPGLRHFWTRLAYSQFSLWILFIYRRIIIRRETRRLMHRKSD